MKKGIHFEPLPPEQGKDEEEEEDADIPEFTMGEALMIYLIVIGILSGIIYLYITQ